MSPNPGFPISLDVRGWPVLVIGGDDEAADKTLRLLEAGAKVTAISPLLNETLRKLAASAKIIHRGRQFRATDVESAVLVLNMIRGDREFSKNLLAMARELTLITHNTSEFQRVPGLKVEDWKGAAVRRQRRNNP